MRDHIKGEDYELWNIVTNGPLATLNKNVEGVDVPKVMHERTTQVKISRGTLLYSQYENFSMKDGETIQEMYTRFTTLTDELKSLGRIIPEKERVEKILTRVLPITWESKITTIQE
ncbi:uncharacterized protein [Nicotiana tomentosiformis]|uniref:uncharacterized protein n=1 Tax=Nicotiana tomentosiformis TaxID=4098 RepID=UPI00388CA346